MSVVFVRLTNTALRLAVLFTRFLFIFFLARYVDPSNVGHYGQFTATVVYCLYFVGLDFYVYTTREILRTPRSECGQLLKGQAALSAVLYAIVLPVTFLILKHAGWPTNLIWWFPLILFLEHINQEIYRLLIALSEQISASILLFVRQGSWAIAIIALMAINVESRNLDAIMALWAIAGTAAAALGVAKLRRLEMGGWSLPIDRKWIMRGVALGGTFLVATLSLRGVQTIDRYWLEALGGIEMVGAYVLFLGMAGALTVFLDAAVFSYAYPELIRLAHERNHALIRLRVRQMLLQTIAFCVAFAIASGMALPFLLDWVDNPIYTGSAYLYPWVLAAMVINSLSMVPHYALYARGFDRPIIYSHLATLPVFVLSTWIVSFGFPLLAVPIGLIAAFAVVLVWKTLAYWLVDRDSSAPGLANSS